jgi:catechol 2,3-dioxygenase-like lactoylglutathione lyase family enzyme
MLSDADLIAFVPATDVDEARDFYTGTLGLSLVEENPAALVYEAHGTMLRVTPVPDMTPAPYTVAGWAVDDIADLVTRLGSRGVVFQRFDGMEQDELGIWRSPGGGLVAWFKDPAGNTLSLTQFQP